MPDDPFDLSLYEYDFTTLSNDKLSNIPALWTEWCCNPSGISMHTPTAVSVPSPDGHSVSTRSDSASDSAVSVTLPQNTFVDLECLSTVVTESTAATTVNGDHEKRDSMDSDDFGGIPVDRQPRKSITGSETIARSLRRNNDNRRRNKMVLARRERNRTAAAKFRAKSKVAKEELKETERAERDLNSALHATMHELKAESLLLKHELLRHSGCDNLAINNYLCRAADQISRAVDTLTSTPKANSSLQNV